MVEKDLGFILRRYNFRETSVIATIYTLRYGKIRGIFKGFYTGKKEFSSPLDIFTLNELMFYPKKSDLWLVSFADLAADYPYLRKSLNKNRVAAVIFRMIDKTMENWEVNAEVFALIQNCLQWLGKEDEYKVFYVFLIKFLTISGLKPEFHRCIVCHTPLVNDVFFSVSRGGMVCRGCQAQETDWRRISRETSSSINYIQKSDFTLACRLKPTLLAQREIFYVLREFLFYHLEIDLKSALKLDNVFRRINSTEREIYS